LPQAERNLSACFENGFKGQRVRRLQNFHRRFFPQRDPRMGSQAWQQLKEILGVYHEHSRRCSRQLFHMIDDP
jgi:hypothetical protein